MPGRGCNSLSRFPLSLPPLPFKAFPQERRKRGRTGWSCNRGRKVLLVAHTLFPRRRRAEEEISRVLRIGILPPCTPAPNLNPLRSKQGKEEGRGLDVGRGKGVSERGKGFLVPHFLPPPFVSRPSLPLLPTSPIIYPDLASSPLFSR